MDKDEWRLKYNNIAYGVYSTKFDVKDKKVNSISIKANDFIEYDPYIFVKQKNGIERLLDVHEVASVLVH
jgi:hypothetical protein